MTSETLVVRLPLSSNAVYTEELADRTNRDAFEQPHNLREIINNNRPSYFNNVSQESVLADDRVVRSELPESRTFAPNVPTPHRQTEGGRARQDHPRSPENRLRASPNSLQDVTASPIVQNYKGLSPDYANPKRVPGTDQNIYPRAPISPEFHERYPQLVDFFKQAVDSHKFLKYHTSKINYELRLCGSTPSNAVASIVIFCAKAIFKDLRSLLNNKHIQRQYILKKPSVLDKFQFPPSKPHLQACSPVIAPFKIVFWREATTPTERRSAMEQVVAKSHSFLTMCGSLVRYGNRTSTMGLLISVDSKLYGLTVDHLFKNQRDEEQPTITHEPDILPDEEHTEANQANWSWVDDVTYEDMDSDRWASENGSETSEPLHAEVMIDHDLTEHDGNFINGHKVDPLPETDISTPFLDWALIEFESGYFERPNAFYLEEDPVHPKFIVELSAAPKSSGVHVFMISGVSGTRKGVMLNSKSYIGGKPGEKLCQAWNVILSDCSRVIDGDCGSLVVDQQTLEVYGHVVASNPLGEAYVVPLHDTFHQITDALGAKDLSLPNPGLLMQNLVTYYSKAGDSGVADAAKLILASMEGFGSISQHDVEDQVRKNPAAFLKQDLKETEDPERSGFLSLLVRRLPLDITNTALDFMLYGSKDFIEAEVLSPEKLEDPGFRSAVLLFKSHAGALEAKDWIDWKTANGEQMPVEVLYGSPTSSRRYTIDNTVTTGANSTSPVAWSNGIPRITSKLLIDTDSVDKDGTGELNDLPEAVVGANRYLTLSTMDPLSIGAFILNLIPDAIRTVMRLKDTVELYKGREETLARLQGDLNDLVVILRSLEQAAEEKAPALALLKGPVSRCAQLCGEFEEFIKVFGEKSKIGSRDWAKMEFIRGDINRFIDALIDYEATIAIGLATITLHTSLLTQNVVGDYNEVIKITSYRLERRLQRIDEKITSLAADQPSLSEDSNIDLQDEKASTEHCLRICKRATCYINSLQFRQRALQTEVLQQGAGYELNQFEAQLLTTKMLSERKNSLVNTIGRFQKHLDSMTFNTGPDRESESLQWQENIVQCLELCREAINTGPDRESEMMQWQEDIKQCLEVCKEATKMSSQKIHIIGKIIAEEDYDRVLVTSLADLFNYRAVKAKSRTTQLLDPMPAGEGRERSKNLPPVDNQLGSQHYQHLDFPPVNPANQNPPCNTLYVGNLPTDVFEEELKTIFSKQRGYKGLCFRTKHNGRMCFVEFEDVSFAARALQELDGQTLHNSIGGGIQLSFSKNPLGVRTGLEMSSPEPQQLPAVMQGIYGTMNSGQGAGFRTTSAPSPGLTAPPGPGTSRMAY